MKKPRKPIARRTRMKSGGPLKRTPIARHKRINRVSKTTAKENRDLAEQRREFAAANGGDEVHEILGGKWRKKTKADPTFWLAVMRRDHDTIQGEPKAKQLARKFQQILDAFNREYRDGGKDWPITLAETAEHFGELE